MIADIGRLSSHEQNLIRITYLGLLNLLEITTKRIKAFEDVESSNFVSPLRGEIIS